MTWSRYLPLGDLHHGSGHADCATVWEVGRIDGDAWLRIDLEGHRPQAGIDPEVNDHIAIFGLHIMEATQISGGVRTDEVEIEGRWFYQPAALYRQAERLRELGNRLHQNGHTAAAATVWVIHEALERAYDSRGHQWLPG